MGMSYQTVTFAIAAGNTTELVAAVPGKPIIVHGYIVSGSAAATTATFKSAAASISGSPLMAGNTNIVAPIHSRGWFQTLPGDALNLTAATGNLAGCVRYSVG